LQELRRTCNNKSGSKYGLRARAARLAAKNRSAGAGKIGGKPFPGGMAGCRRFDDYDLHELFFGVVYQSYSLRLIILFFGGLRALFIYAERAALQNMRRGHFAARFIFNRIYFRDFPCSAGDAQIYTIGGVQFILCYQNRLLPYFFRHSLRYRRHIFFGSKKRK